ncbi:hypothetical protein N7490_006798 [Penicillium lividum]|nr:hypothetical protein N7490_006798 [Penicillium lividum]
MRKVGSNLGRSFKHALNDSRDAVFCSGCMISEGDPGNIYSGQEGEEYISRGTLRHFDRTGLFTTSDYQNRNAGNNRTQKKQTNLDMPGKLGVQGGTHPQRKVEYSPSTGKDVGKLRISPALDANMAKTTRLMTQDIAGNGLQNPGMLDKKNEEERGDEGCLLSKADMLKLEEWNRVVPDRPDAPAVCAWDGDLTYGELDALSSVLAAHLAERGVGPEIFVPLCFEKSRWTTVAMLGVMKAGGAFVLLDLSHPPARLRGIC